MIAQIPNTERDELMAAVAKMTRNLPIFIEMMQVDAKIRRAKFEALVNEGFSEQQAIELCKGSLS